MHVYTCLFACLHRDPRFPGTLHSLSALFPEGKVSLNMKFTVLGRLSSQLTPSQLSTPTASQHVSTPSAGVWPPSVLHGCWGFKLRTSRVYSNTA